MQESVGNPGGPLTTPVANQPSRGLTDEPEPTAVQPPQYLSLFAGLHPACASAEGVSPWAQWPRPAGVSLVVCCGSLFLSVSCGPFGALRFAGWLCRCGPRAVVVKVAAVGVGVAGRLLHSRQFRF